MRERAGLALKDVTFHHTGSERAAVRDVSLEAKAGERVAIVGPNGAGKSTLLSLICGLDFANSGEVRVGPHRVAKSTVGDVRRLVGLVFQNPDDQLFCPTIAEDIAFGPRQFGWPEGRVASAVGGIAAQLELEPLLGKSPLHLSLGERQRAALATVLVHKPEILLLDEPTATLDPRRRRQMIEMLAALDQTLLIATHDLDLALDVCPRAVLIDEGEVAVDGLSETILKDEALLKRHGLELPLRFHS